MGKNGKQRVMKPWLWWFQRTWFFIRRIFFISTEISVMQNSMESRASIPSLLETIMGFHSSLGIRAWRGDCPSYLQTQFSEQRPFPVGNILSASPSHAACPHSYHSMGKSQCNDFDFLSSSEKAIQKPPASFQPAIVFQGRKPFPKGTPACWRKGSWL